MKYISITSITILLLITPVFASEAVEGEQPNLVISELQLADVNSASNEFVEIANTSAEMVDVTGFTIEYRSATSDTWRTKAELEGIVIGYGRLLISTYIETGLYMTSGLSGSGGHIRIIDAEMREIDRVGWGSAIQPEGSSVEPHELGNSLKRRVNEDGYFVDANDNSIDFISSEAPTPHSDPLFTAPEQDRTPEEIIDSPVSKLITSEPKTSGASTESAKILITELVPDPASPLVDAEHEMIELHNPHARPINLQSYVLTSGEDERYSFTFPSITLAPGEYRSFFSADTNLTLTNSGSVVTLRNAMGNIVSSVEYPKIKAGYAWSYINDNWVLATPSPNKVNALNSGVLGSVNDDSQSDESTFTQDVSYPVVSSSDQSSENSESESSAFEDGTQEETIDGRILAGAAAIGLLYITYEYRNEIRTFSTKLRRNLENRRERRQES